MFSLQRFLGKDGKFFDLLEEASQQAMICAHSLRLILESPEDMLNISKLRQARQKNKALIEEISEIVVKTFVTVIEREDIEALANALYKIPKPIEKFAERFIMSRDLISTDLFNKQAILVEASAIDVCSMVKEFRKGVNIESIKSLNSKLQKAEAEADFLEMNLLNDLFHNNKDPIKIILIKDLYDLLEKSIDRCRDSGNVITHIFLKNS
jgi:uncharacterized protein Yka (UPF0111/DUF47 family)